MQGTQSLNSIWRYTFDAQILCNDDSRLLANSYRSTIGVSSYTIRCYTAVWRERFGFIFFPNKTKREDIYRQLLRFARHIHSASRRQPRPVRVPSSHKFPSGKLDRKNNKWMKHSYNCSRTGCALICTKTMTKLSAGLRFLSLKCTNLCAYEIHQ